MKLEIAITMVLFLLAVRLYSTFLPRTITKVNSILPALDTGDLLLFSGNSIPEKMIRFWTGCPFSHVAMVVRDGNDLFLWEADIGQKHRDGPRLIPLRRKFKRYSGNKTIAFLKLTKKRPRLQRTLRLIYSLLYLKMDYNMTSWVHSCYKKENEVFCSELIAKTLDLLGIVKKERDYNYYSPSTFFSLEGNLQNSYQNLGCYAL